LTATLKPDSNKTTFGLITKSQGVLDDREILRHSSSLACNVKGYLKIQWQNVIVILRSYPELIPFPSWEGMGEEAFGDFAKLKNKENNGGGYIKWKT
jgi:hypothetical protein